MRCWQWLLLAALAGESCRRALRLAACARRRCRRRRLNQALSLTFDMPRGSCMAPNPRLAVHVLPLCAHACSMELRRLLPGLLLGSGAVLGLDCEWEPELKARQHSRVAVIQLSSASDCIILQPLHLTPPRPPHGSTGSPSPTNPHHPNSPVPPAPVQGHNPANVLTQQQSLPGDKAPASPEAADSAAAPTHQPPVHLCARGSRAAPEPPPTAEGEACGVGPQAGPAPCVVEPPCWIPRELRDVLEDPGVIKAGVGIHEDVRRLRRDFGIHVKGALDVRLALQRLAPQHLAAGGSLQALSHSLLGATADKRLQLSAWHRRELTRDQLVYAAHDALLSRELAVAVARLSLQGSRSCPPSQAPPDGGAAAAAAPTPTAPLAAEELHRLFEPMLDQLPHRGWGGNRRQQQQQQQQGEVPVFPGASTAAAAAAAPPQPPAPRRKESIPTRKTQLYENCRLLAPDGSVLCTCSCKKISWYLDRGLALVVCEDPLTAQLKFEPRGRGNADDKYYLSDKVNRCCACGKAGDYLRHNVVPHCYRSLFPESHKSHLSHDVVLLCQACQQVCGGADHRRMLMLARQHGAPLDNPKYIPDTADGAVRSAARALTSSQAALPDDRRAELEALLLQHYGVRELTPELLARAGQLQPRTPNTDWRSHASVVVGQLSTEGIDAFVRGWRQHFLDVMRPRFLPSYWSVAARVANSSASTAAAGGDTLEASVESCSKAEQPAG